MYVIKYTGQFGFIKPWTAVRDDETFSQQFLTPSIVAGIERKLFPELLKKDFGIYKIKRHRLSYSQISLQKEVTQVLGWNYGNIGGKKHVTRGTIKKGVVNFAPITRGVLLNPVLFLAFDSLEDAKIAQTQHICLARNEDMLYADDEILNVTEEEFDTNEELFRGFELIFENTDDSFMVGYNRMNNNEPMYGTLKVVGNPVRNNF